MTIAELIAAANIGTIIEGERYYVARHTFEDGSFITCCIRPRAANSRGANRGRHEYNEFNYKPVGAKYAKTISKAKALELLK